MWWFIFILIFLFSMAFWIDRKRRQDKSYLPPTDVKPGENKNVTMGDNKYTNQ